MKRIGIMQGRLLPRGVGPFQCFPAERWAREFPIAAQAELDCIEWIYDRPLDENPLGADSSIVEIERAVQASSVGVYSVCADYFMSNALVRGALTERRKNILSLESLIRRAGALGVERIVLPFVDGSSLSGRGERDELAAILSDCLSATESSGLEFHLETDLGPSAFAELLERTPNPRVRVNYDSGNSASLGYRPADEFTAYGARVGSVHIKDRVLGGGTVPLGTGDTDFESLARALEGVSYEGDFILQVARGSDGDEVAWAVANRRFVQEHFARVAK
jgi:hexulose-6-phosphate isomerase